MRESDAAESNFIKKKASRIPSTNDGKNSNTYKLAGIKCSFHSPFWSAQGAAKAVLRRGFGEIWWCGKSMLPVSSFSTKDEQNCPPTETCFLFSFPFFVWERMETCLAASSLLSTSSPHAEETRKMIQTRKLQKRPPRERERERERENSWTIFRKDWNVSRGPLCCN